MLRFIPAAILLPALIAPARPSVAATTDGAVPLAGRWALNRQLSEFPKELGFNAEWAMTGDDDSGGGHRGRRGSGAPPFSARPESEEEATRSRLLVTEVRTPPAWLSIAQTADAITITNERGDSRTFHPDGRQESLKLTGDVQVATTARVEGGNLIVTYDIEPGRQLRYTYATTANPPRLMVDVQFVERGGGDSVRRLYDPTTASAPAPVPETKPAPPWATPAGGAPASAPAGSEAGRPAVPSTQEQKADLRPGAELKGLTRLGIVVEDLGSQALACGLTQDALEKAVTKSLTDGGFQVVRNSDEDTYLYVNVMSASVGGTCVSRYDATLYTHTTATLPYSSGPVLVQVELLHKGGMAGGAPAANAQAVTRGVTEYVNGFVTEIHGAGSRP